MGTVWYLYRRSFCNRLKKALRRPATYFYVFIVLFYLFYMPFALRNVADVLGIASPEGMAAVLTILAFWTIPSTLISFARRRGLVYRHSDVHFLFPSPFSPKQVLLYAHLKTILTKLFLTAFAVACGSFLFQAAGWQLALYGVFSLVLQNVLEAGLMLILYGSERIGEGQRNIIAAIAYGLAGFLVFVGLYTLFTEGFSQESVLGFLHSDVIQMVPLVGWYVAVVHLIFVGPSAVNLLGTALYMLTLTAVVVGAVFLKCTGTFYEDAMTFADDYEEALASRRRGERKSLRKAGHSRSQRKASVSWRGRGAAALFYRQLLEFKKNRYFIFDMHTFVALLVGVALPVWLRGTDYMEVMGERGLFLFPGVAAYVIFIFSAAQGKWSKELDSPYTFLIPDTAFNKLFYATAMQHIQNLVNACLITLPAAALFGFPPVITVLCILSYLLVAGNKIYARAVARAAMGDSLGVTGQQLFQLFLQSIAIIVTVIGAVMGITAGGAVLGFLLMDVFMALMTVIYMVIAMLNFDRIQL